MNWIPITEKLPDLEERVLVVAIVRPGEVQEMFAERRDYGWVIEDDQDWGNDCVTHWMPLPTLPIITREA